MPQYTAHISCLRKYIMNCSGQHPELSRMMIRRILSVAGGLVNENIPRGLNYILRCLSFPEPTPMISLLLEFGCDPNSECVHQPLIVLTPLCQSIRHGLFGCAMELLNDPRINIHAFATVYEGATPELIRTTAISLSLTEPIENYYTLFKRLLDKGADLEVHRQYLDIATGRRRECPPLIIWLLAFDHILEGIDPLIYLEMLCMLVAYGCRTKDLLFTLLNENQADSESQRGDLIDFLNHRIPVGRRHRCRFLIWLVELADAMDNTTDSSRLCAMLLGEHIPRPQVEEDMGDVHLSAVRDARQYATRGMLHTTNYYNRHGTKEGMFVTHEGSNVPTLRSIIMYKLIRLAVEGKEVELLG